MNPREQDYLLSSYTYDLPPELIAQDPANPRDQARMLVVQPDHSYSHSHFYDLSEWLKPGDLLVFNDTKVIPARLYGHKSTGAIVEILLLEPTGRDRWLALVKPGKRMPLGAEIWFGDRQLRAEVVAIDSATGGRELQFDCPGDQSFFTIIENLGVVPLPPYIQASQSQPQDYQTVYAKHPGAVAAPTAGLHFSVELLQQLTQAGINQAFITLHVGLGTFRPVEVEDIRCHDMHQEWIEVAEAAIALIQTTKAQGGRVIGVGTTVARALETSGLTPFRGKTELLIYPGYEWRVLDGLITNFHLPRSSLLMMVAAFLGDRQFLLDLYQAAIAAKYRFYSFGDGMLLWR
ncbi:MAG: tRNA preQ1(34) S-adenosylmethionine ribosyltransferase-isomerase QueA [Pseudanabaenaceae cyanobacterium bins.68]|nr:tRNA preQ1(34) S-adenosylmethionine ribosyltransferase-isomerase QueA [Pseudanabaenaceae cyanobacterium bins.68]